MEVTHLFFTTSEVEERTNFYNREIENIDLVRLRIAALYPASRLLEVSDVSRNVSNDAIREKLTEAFEKILNAIDRAEVGIHNGDISLNDLEPIVAETFQQLGEDAKGVVQEYVETQQNQATLISLVTLAVELGLTVTAFFKGSIVLARAAAVFGTGMAVYELEQADDLNTLAGAQEAGGEPLIDDPDAARFNYVMALVNMALAGSDLLSTVDEGAAVLGALARNTEGTEVLARLDPEDLERLGRAIRDNDEELLEQLQNQLGTDFDPAYDALQGVVDEGLQGLSNPEAFDLSLLQHIPEAQRRPYIDLVASDPAGSIYFK